MTIHDYWLNPLDTSVPAVTVLGYRENLEEFPHEIYSFLSSSIRDEDIKNVRLLYRFLRGIQTEFEVIYGKILNLPLLYSPAYCPEEYLDYLAMQVGITSPDLDYLWGELTTVDKRRLISIFVRSIMTKSTDIGIVSLIQSMTGKYTEIREYFDFRWIVSGDGEYNQETALGFEDNSSIAGDPWLLSEDSMTMGVVPDSVVFGTFYTFKVNTLMASIVDGPVPPNPPNVRVIYRPTRESYLMIPVFDSITSAWTVDAEIGQVFGQTVSPFSTRITDFRVGFENDTYIFDIRVMDDGTINKNMVKALAMFSRSISERIYIRYYNLIDRFSDTDLDNWSDEGGTVTLDTDEDIVTIGDASAESIMRSNVNGDDSWTDYSFGVRLKAVVAEKIASMRFFWQDANNYMELGLYPATEPDIPAGQWGLMQVVAGVPMVIAVGNLDHFDLNINYFFRIVAFVSGANLIVRGYQDENQLFSGPIPLPWAVPEGKVEIACEVGANYVVSDVEVHPYPMDEHYVGP